MLLNTLDTTVLIQRGRKLGYALPMKTDYEEAQNLKRYNVKECPNQADKYKVLKKIDGISIYTRTYVTTDSDQMGQIYLGQEELKVRRIGLVYKNFVNINLLKNCFQ